MDLNETWDNGQWCIDCDFQCPTWAFYFGPLWLRCRRPNHCRVADTIECNVSVIDTYSIHSTMYSEDEDDEVFEGLYENGHWEWDSKTNELVFISDLPSIDEISTIAPTCIIGPIEFKDDLDLLEQHRFKNRFQRKMTENDVVTIQDVKDVVLYTAPQSILTPAIINILHLEMTERFLRALVLYFQYYLQIADEMCRRSLEQERKIPTENSIVIEKMYRENIEDLRLVVAKEYSAMFLGGGEFGKYHHMGASRSSRSLSVKDAILYETILRISIQIIWLSLGRKSFNQIELEVHRMFKSTAFNVAEHRLHTHYEDKMSPEERFVLLGHCLKHNSRNISRSPLLDEVFCHRNIDFRLYGLGFVKFKKLEPRLRLIERMLIAPEDVLMKMGYSLGIIGMPRNNFDTMLREIEMPVGTTSSSISSRSSSVRTRSVSRASRAGLKKNSVKAQKKLFADIFFPEKEETDMPRSFPSQTVPNNACSQTQRLKWLRRVARYNEERVKRNQLKNKKRK